MRRRLICPACTLNVSRTFLYMPNNVDQRYIKHDSYSSRKAPEFMSYQLNRCPSCDLVFAPFVPEEEWVLQCYEKSTFVSKDESLQASRTYLSILESTLATIDSKSLIVDVGASDGSFLQLLWESGFSNIGGIEPSPQAVRAAPPDIRMLIKIGDYKIHMPGIYNARMVTSFMTLEHLLDPFDAVCSFYNSLEVGGILCIVVHNHRALVNRILWRRSPIVDVEHLQLFSPISVTAMLRRAGFVEVVIKPFFNSYSLSYWLKLSPLPRFLKSWVDHVLCVLGVHKVLVSIPVGNICILATK